MCKIGEISGFIEHLIDIIVKNQKAGQNFSDFAEVAESNTLNNAHTHVAVSWRPESARMSTSAVRTTRCDEHVCRISC